MSRLSAAAASSPIAQHFNSSDIPTRSLSGLPFPVRELLKLPLRAIYQAEIFVFVTVPRSLARLVGLESVVNPALVRSLWPVGESDTFAAVAATANRGPEAVTVNVNVDDARLGFSDVFQTMRRFSGFFSYMTSRWSLACFTVALVLNRVTIYASTRRRLSLRWDRRLALRIVPIILFVAQILKLLRTIRCQTSPDYSTFRYGRPGTRMMLDYAGEGGWLHVLASTLLPWETDQQSCTTVNMRRLPDTSDIPYGSFALLWPVFMCLCLSHFVETLSCALQGKSMATEAGMTIFEHSLAFAEAETMISQSVGLGLFGIPKPISKDMPPVSTDGSSSVHLLTRVQVLERMNITPELLLIVLISCCNILTSNILDVFGRQSRYRLVNTTLWGLCFMACIIWGFLDSSPGNETGVLKFPTVCIVDFVPHLLILIGILICLAIYAVALLITTVSLPPDLPQPSSWRERFALAHENMQGANQIQTVRLNMHDDFYTTLLRVGYAALTAASEAVFLNEGKSVIARSMTWLEESRLAEIEASREIVPYQEGSSARSIHASFEHGDPFSFEIPERPDEWESGYSREKKIKKTSNATRSVQSQTNLGGVGAFQGAARCYYGFSFFRGIFLLLLRWLARSLSRLLDLLGITSRPQWLDKFIGAQKKGAQPKIGGQLVPLDFWILTDDGELELPEDDEFDVEKEMRKRESTNRPQWDEADEKRLDIKLYNWWKAGGSWGNQDESADYMPSDNDMNDSTSTLSATTSESEWEEYSSDGYLTPTERDPFGYPREESPPREAILDPESLARLLNPRDKESKQEACILAAHLTADQDGRIMTRTQYRRQLERDRARVLMPPCFAHTSLQQTSIPQSNANDRRRPTPEEEVEILERLIISRRARAVDSCREQPSWKAGASGLGPEGPQCVICQTNPRSIIAWPCRCLCVCEDCRVSLAMNNFGSCVTCRQEVAGFVRLWVP